MAECKHELKDLIGMADGIHCRACGAVLQSMPAREEKKEPAKKEGKKNARRG